VGRRPKSRIAAAEQAAVTHHATLPTGRFGQVLDDWIYAERRLQATLNIELLERHAETQLARALNSRRLIAVVGSGVSNGYGQPTWGELLQSTINAIWDELEANTPIGSLPELEPTLEDSQNVEAQRRKAIVSCLRRKRSEVAQAAEALLNGCESRTADTIPFLFELCENVLVALHRTKLASERVNSRAESRLARSAMRARLRWQIKDARGRVEILLGRILRSERFTPESDEAKKIGDLLKRLSHPIVADVMSSADNDAFAASIARILFEKGAMSSFIADLLERGAGGQLTRLKHVLAAQLRRNSVDGPDTRHVVEASLLLLSTPDLVKALRKLVKLAENDTGDVCSRLSRRGVLPRHRDPLAMLFDECNVHRFLTTNYDDEIELLFESRGFRAISRDDLPQDVLSTQEQHVIAEPSRVIMTSPASERAEVIVHEAGAAAFLYDYGADTRDNRPQVLHIHGRAQTPSSWLVLSERDYRERYARDGDPSVRTDDAMRLIFTANPLFFVGLGMEEPDILRPLRAFSEGRSRLCDRPAVALLPAEHSDSEKDPWQAIERKQRLTLTRYGVYLIHYGHINLQPLSKTRPISGSSDKPRDLPYMAQLLNAHKAIAERLAGKDTRAGAGWEVQKIENVEGETNAVAAIEQVRSMLSILDAVAYNKLNRTEKDALCVLNNGIRGSILTTFLSAWLANMGERWKSWLDDWSAAPKPREPFGFCLPINSDAPEYTRHRTLLRNLDRETNATTGPQQIESAPKSDRFFAGAPSPAFQVLRAALAMGVRSPKAGRRIFYLLGERGTGRGHVFAAMRSPRRFAQMCEWLGLIDERQVPTGPSGSEPNQQIEEDSAALGRTKTVGRIFFNLGLSHEVISTFDRLIWILEDFAERLCPDFDEAIKSGREGLRDDRLGRLRWILSLLSAPQAGPRSNATMQRIVVVINHVNIFFDAAGKAKNAQIARLFEALIDRKYTKAPIDFLFFMNEGHLPKSLRKQVKKNQVRWLRPAKLSPGGEVRLQQRIERSLGLDAQLLSRQDTSADEIYLHFLQRMRPITLAVRFFPRAAALLLHVSGKPASSMVAFNNDTMSEWPRLGFARKPDIAEFQRRIRSEFESNLGAASVEAIELLGANFAGGEIEEVMLQALQEYVADHGGSSNARLERAVKAVRDGVNRMKTESPGRVVAKRAGIFPNSPPLWAITAMP
jgi:hypothetical protein